MQRIEQLPHCCSEFARNLFQNQGFPVYGQSHAFRSTLDHSAVMSNGFLNGHPIGRHAIGHFVVLQTCGAQIAIDRALIPVGDLVHQIPTLLPGGQVLGDPAERIEHLYILRTGFFLQFAMQTGHRVLAFVYTTTGKAEIIVTLGIEQEDSVIACDNTTCRLPVQNTQPGVSDRLSDGVVDQMCQKSHATAFAPAEPLPAKARILLAQPAEIQPMIYFSAYLGQAALLTPIIFHDQEHSVLKRHTTFTATAYSLVFGLLSLLAAAPAFSQHSIGPVTIDDTTRSAFEQVRNDERVQEALVTMLDNEDATIAEQIRITEIPAPPFMEERRARDYLQQMQARGLNDAWIDEEGNVIGRWSGTGSADERPLFVISAHLDTVFPIETDVAVQERDGRLYAPGISDDARGLAVLLTLIETLTESGIETVADILFVGTVGEEGRGDLRGVKALFRDYPQIDGFVSIDGTSLTGITNGATGSRRFEVHFSGPGGHSFSAFGMASATHAMGRAITKISDLEVPTEPRTTFTVGTVAGGTSVNAIAGDAVFALDMRSNEPAALQDLEARVKAVVQEAVEEENARWDQPGQISVEFQLIGDRPAGMTEADHPLLQSTAMAFSTVGSELETLRRSSTDSNVPMSLGVPAVTIGGGGRSSGAHSLSEWYEAVDSHQGPQAALLLTLTMAGIDGLTEPLLTTPPALQ